MNTESAKKDTIEIYQDNSAKQEWRWRRKAINGRIVGASTEGYSNKSDCEDNIARQFIECDIK